MAAHERQRPGADARGRWVGRPGAVASVAPAPGAYLLMLTTTVEVALRPRLSFTLSVSA